MEHFYVWQVLQNLVNQDSIVAVDMQRSGVNEADAGTGPL